MSLKLSAKQLRRYNARQLKKWYAQHSLGQAFSEVIDAQSNRLVKINLNGISSIENFHQRLATEVSLPEHCAVNLDALYDVLMGDVAEPVEFIWTCAAEDMARYPEALTGLKAMLESVAAACADISIKY